MKIKEDAFSGLESAIILIAFVVVATVFGMSVLNSGFYASQQTEKTTVSGYKMASSTLYIEGGVYATLKNGAATALDTVQFSAAIPETGQAQDLRDLTIVYTHSVDTSIQREYTYRDATADATHFGVDGNYIMLPGDRRNFRLAEVNGPIPGGWFTIDLKPKKKKKMGPQHW